ncbi:MAG: FemAB family PEP-CTERM system-associated protein [Rhodospirillales bacterium]|nr:FemAB family PEP-CTERM system-associated protein [Rhodospirillales bacterium]
MSLAVRELEPVAAGEWDRFVAAHPDGTFFHRAAWREVIGRAFGHAMSYSYVARDGAITGVLPMGQVKTALFGNALIAVPFCVYGGPLAADAESAEALLAHAAALRARAGAPVAECRFRDAPEGATAAALAAGGWTAGTSLYVTFRKPIVADDDANLKAIPRKQRAMVRKGIERGLTSRADRDADLVHRIYAESVRNLGTPVFPRRYFRALLDAFGGDCDVLTVRDGEAPIASVLNFYFRDEVLPYYGGGTARARERAGNDFMYWEVMRRAAARGCRMFDFGRSKEGTGAHAFKRNWGFAPAPLQYRFLLAPGARVPELNPLNPKFRLFIAAWKRLPLPLANLLGPPIVRGLA